MKCQHCKKENKEGWFYCRNCGERAFERKFTTNTWMRGEMSKRTDIEFSESDMESSFRKMNNA